MLSYKKIHQGNRPQFKLGQRANTALDRSIDLDPPCCRLPSIAPRVLTESCNVRKKTLLECKKKRFESNGWSYRSCFGVQYGELFVFPTECWAPIQWRRLVVTGMERHCWLCSGQLMIGERCFPVILSRLKDHNRLTFAICDGSIFPTCGWRICIGAHTYSMVARHAKFECFPWIRLDTVHALLDRSYATQSHNQIVRDQHLQAIQMT